MPTPRPPVGGSEESKQKVDQEEPGTGPGWPAFCSIGASSWHTSESNRATPTWPRRPAGYVSGRDGPIAKGTADRHQQRRDGQRRAARGGGHRDPVDLLGQAGRERGRVPRQGQPRQRRRAAAEQQLRERRRRDRLRPRPSPSRRSTTSTAGPSAEARRARRRRQPQAQSRQRTAARQGQGRQAPGRQARKTAAPDDDVPF